MNDVKTNSLYIYVPLSLGLSIFSFKPSLSCLFVNHTRVRENKNDVKQKAWKWSVRSENQIEEEDINESYRLKPGKFMN